MSEEQADQTTVTGATPEQEAKCRELQEAWQEAARDCQLAAAEFERADHAWDMAKLKRHTTQIELDDFVEDYWAEKEGQP